MIPDIEQHKFNLILSRFVPSRSQVTVDKLNLETPSLVQWASDTFNKQYEGNKLFNESITFYNQLDHIRILETDGMVFVGKN